MKRGVLFLSFMMACTTAVYAQYRVTRCSDLAEQPVIYEDGQPKELLAIYLYGNDSTGIGGNDCWVFHHPNDKDYVVVPRSWYPDTGGPRQRLIEDAMQAITDSRRTYAEYGTMENSLHYILNDVDYGDTAGEKFWVYQEDQCWMRSGVPTLSGSGRESRRQIFAHEIGHCFVEENVPKTASLPVDLDAWFDESVSEYLSSEAYNKVNNEYEYAMDYDFNALFMQPYSAYILWYYYAREKGISSVVPLMNALTGLKTNTARTNYLKSIGFDEVFHNFLFDFTLRRIKDSGTGEPIPGSGVMPDHDFVLDPAESEIKIPGGIDFGQREIINITVPEGFNITLHPPRGEAVNFRSSLMPALTDPIQDWDSTVNLEGFCFSPNDISIMISHLETDGIGEIVIPYELQAKADCCSGEGETLDGCAIGSWDMDIPMLDALMDFDISGSLNVTFDSSPIGHVKAEFDLRFTYRNGNYDVHKGTVSACVVPTSPNSFKLTGVTLGPGNIHRDHNVRRGESKDMTPFVQQYIENSGYSFSNCNPDNLTVIYNVLMHRVR